jgi:acetylglutamate kinase
MKPIVIKIGGSVLGSYALEDVVVLQKRGLPLVVVHGGGKTISSWLSQWGLEANFSNGLRITDAQSLEVVTAVLAGLVNKQLVVQLNSLGGRAFGLTGIDGGLIEARIKSPHLGYVGEVVKINTKPLEMLLNAGYLPLIAPLGYQPPQASSAAGMLLNINADTVAGEVALALNATQLIFLTNVAGIVDGTGKLISSLSPTEARSLIARQIISAGMVPKVEACLHALSAVPQAQIVNGRSSGALLTAIEGHGDGTKIVGGE